MFSVIVKHEFSGLHRWPEAKTYLYALHRHKFYVTVEVPVPHGNRSIEFHELLGLVNRICQGLPSSERQSCEEMAEEIAREVHYVYDVWPLSVLVMEDNECGARWSHGPA